MSAFDKFVDHLYKTHKPIGGRASGAPRTPNIWWSYVCSGGIATRSSIKTISAGNRFWVFSSADSCIEKMIKLAMEEYDQAGGGIFLPILARIFHQPSISINPHNAAMQGFTELVSTTDIDPEYYDTTGKWVDGDVIKNYSSGNPKLEDDQGDYVWTVTSTSTGNKYSRRLGTKAQAEDWLRGYYKTASMVK